MNVNVWATGREWRGSRAKHHSVDVARYPLSMTHTITRLFELAFTWEAWNIERGLKEAVRKSTSLEDSRRYLCLDGGLIQSQRSIQHIWRPRKEAQSKGIVLINSSPCWRVLPVQRRQDIVSQYQNCSPLCRECERRGRAKFEVNW